MAASDTKDGGDPNNSSSNAAAAGAGAAAARGSASISSRLKPGGRKTSAPDRIGIGIGRQPRRWAMIMMVMMFFFGYRSIFNALGEKKKTVGSRSRRVFRQRHYRSIIENACMYIYRYINHQSISIVFLPVSLYAPLDWLQESDSLHGRILF